MGTNESAKKKNKEVIKAAVAAAAKKIDATANQIAHEDPKKVEIKNLETEAGKVAVELKEAQAELLESKKTKEEETVQKKRKRPKKMQRMLQRTRMIIWS